MYYKDDVHKEYTLQLLKKFGFHHLEDNREYGVFCYLASATYKKNDLEKAATSEGIDLNVLKARLPFFSSSEQAMIRFALQLFDSELDDITLPEVFHHLDEKNKKVVLETIKFRFQLS